MNKGKPLYEKVSIILAIFASICTITGKPLLSMLSDTEPDNGSDISDISDTESTEDYSEYDNVQDNNNIIIDVETEVKNIKSKYYYFQQNKAAAINYKLDSQIQIYYISNGSMSINIAKGYNNTNYSRIYYFDENGCLYFSFIFNKSKENRLYFYDDILIRYIDEDKKIYDINDNLYNCKWEEFALKESYEIFNSDIIKINMN